MCRGNGCAWSDGARNAADALCISQTPKIKASPEQILSALDDSIGQAYSALKVYLRPEEYYDKFAEMFHEEDRPIVR